MERRKRKNAQGFLGDIKKLIAERDRFYKGLEEIKTLEESIDRLREEQKEKEKAFDMEFDSSNVHGSYSRLISDKCPGREVFFEEHRCQCFDTDKIEKMKLTDGSNYECIRILLENRVNINNLIVKESMLNLFILMGIDQDDDVVQSCYDVLAINIKHFIPKFRQVIKTFLNWGATCESLGILESEKPHHFPKGIRPKKTDPTKRFKPMNYSSVLDYVGEICRRNPDCYSRNQKAVLLKCLVRIGLDETFSSVTIPIGTCISKIVESFSSWDTFTVQNICRIIHDERDHFHNQVTVVTSVLPKINRCSDLSSGISYNILSSMVQSKSEFKYPYEDEDIAEIVKNIKVNPDDADGLYRLYVLMQLLNFMIYQRNIVNNQTVLKKIMEKLKELEWTISKSSKMFDAAFVKGRISYCCAMWCLSTVDRNSNQ